MESSQKSHDEPCALPTQEQCDGKRIDYKMLVSKLQTQQSPTY